MYNCNDPDGYLGDKHNYSGNKNLKIQPKAAYGEMITYDGAFLSNNKDMG
jgi:hypothetical protein